VTTNNLKRYNYAVLIAWHPAAGIVRSLHNVWKAKDISKCVKTKLCQTPVQSILLYNTGTWTLKEHHKMKLEVFEMSVLRRILGISPRDRRRNPDIKKELDIKLSIVEIIQKRTLSYISVRSHSTND